MLAGIPPNASVAYVGRYPTKRIRCGLMLAGIPPNASVAVAPSELQRRVCWAIGRLGYLRPRDACVCVYRAGQQPVET